MKNYVLKNGLEIDVYEMMKIKQFYEVQCTKEYIEDNFDMSDEQAEKLAYEVREKMDDEDITESEALGIILDTYGLY